MTHYFETCPISGVLLLIALVWALLIVALMAYVAQLDAIEEREAHNEDMNAQRQIWGRDERNVQFWLSLLRLQAELRGTKTVL